MARGFGASENRVTGFGAREGSSTSAFVAMGGKARLSDEVVDGIKKSAEQMKKLDENRQSGKSILEAVLSYDDYEDLKNDIEKAKSGLEKAKSDYVDGKISNKALSAAEEKLNNLSAKLGEHEAAESEANEIRLEAIKDAFHKVNEQIGKANSYNATPKVSREAMRAAYEAFSEEVSKNFKMPTGDEVLEAWAGNAQNADYKAYKAMGAVSDGKPVFMFDGKGRPELVYQFNVGKDKTGFKFPDTDSDVMFVNVTLGSLVPKGSSRSTGIVGMEMGPGGTKWQNAGIESL